MLLNNTKFSEKQNKNHLQFALSFIVFSSKLQYAFLLFLKTDIRWSQKHSRILKFEIFRNSLVFKSSKIICENFLACTTDSSNH